VLLLGLATGSVTAAAGAHEFWIEPSSFTPERGGLLAVRHCVGDGFDGWSLARNAQRIEQFIAAGPAGEQSIVGLDGSDPAGVVRLASAGGHVLAYRSNQAFQEMPAVRFEAYLEDKGLERIIELRKAQGMSHRKAREVYSRHAKALIQIGDAGGGPTDRSMGLRLELVAEAGLFRPQSDDRRSFRLLHEGRPLAGALVAATRPGTADGDQRIRSDVDGRVSFSMREPGMWRVAAVHMIDTRGNVRADWESLWASLTFELPPKSPIANGTRVPVAACRNKIMPPALQAGT
jgi:uncharacterized GH25 family protein